MSADVRSGTPSGGGLRGPGRVLRPLAGRLAELWRARELLAQLVRKELKVRYKSSALGFLWSLVTPALMTVVFTVVFRVVVPIPVDDFAAFFLSGFLVWQFFQNSCQGSIHSIVGNGDLIKKVWFPREVLPLSHVLAQLAHLLLALLVVSPYFVWTRGWDVLLHLPAMLAAIALLTVFTSGMAMLVAGVNVPFRDLQELIVVFFLVWFYATPVLYPLALVQATSARYPLVSDVAQLAIALNPMTWFVTLFRDSAYGPVVAAAAPRADELVSLAPAWPDPGVLALAAAIALATFALGYVAFQRLALTFAKEV